MSANLPIKKKPGPLNDFMRVIGICLLWVSGCFFLGVAARFSWPFVRFGWCMWGGCQ